MKNIRAKFRVGSVTKHAGAGGEQIVAYPVGGAGGEENKSFATATPGGELKLHISPDTEAFGELQPGQTFYMDLSEAPE